MEEQYDSASGSVSSASNNVLTATTTVTRDDHYYNMNHKNQGFAYIFNHDEFQNNLKRRAADIDEDRLKRCLKNLGFDVQCPKNLKVAEIRDQIKEAQKLDHTDNNCFLVFVLSHGDEKKIQAFDNTYDPSEMFWNQFTADKCPTLAGKPKLFFMQCCRGDKLDPGIKLVYQDNKLVKTSKRTECDGNIKTQSYNIPIYSDFCIMYATTEGHFAFQNEIEGSWFVKYFCEELEKYAYSEHLLTILTFVNRRVATEFRSKSKCPDKHKKKQNPFLMSSLTRLMKFIEHKEEE